MNYENVEELKEKIRENLKKRNINSVKQILEGIKPQDIALLFEEISDEEMVVLYRILSKNLAVETFAEMDSDLQEKLIKALTDKELKEVIQELFTDDTVDLIEEMPSNVVKRILRTIPPEADPPHPAADTSGYSAVFSLPPEVPSIFTFYFITLIS